MSLSSRYVDIGFSPSFLEGGGAAGANNPMYFHDGEINYTKFCEGIHPSSLLCFTHIIIHRNR